MQSDPYSNVRTAVGYRSALTASRIDYTQSTFAVGASVTTGVGVSSSTAAGGFGGFSESGTTTTTNSVKITYPEITGASNNNMAVESNWSNNLVQCVIDGKGDVSEEWNAAFNSVAGGGGTPGALPVAAGKCFTEAPFEAVTYETEVQSTWSAGVTIASRIGINLSAQAGWTSDASLTLETKTSAPVCGTGNFPNYQGGASWGEIQVH